MHAQASGKRQATAPPASSHHDEVVELAQRLLELLKPSPYNSQAQAASYGTVEDSLRDLLDADSLDYRAALLLHLPDAPAQAQRIAQQINDLCSSCRRFTRRRRPPRRSASLPRAACLLTTKRLEACPSGGHDVGTRTDLGAELTGHRGTGMPEAQAANKLGNT